MIDRMRKAARAMRILALPSLALAVLCLCVAVYVVFSSTSAQGDRYLFPAIVGLLWSLSSYGFIETFRHVPDRLDGRARLHLRLKRGLARLWYWMIGLVFIGTTATVAILTLRIFTVWVRDHVGH